MEDRIELSQEAEKEFKKEMAQDAVETAITNNQLEFTFKDELYRVSKPSYKQKQVAQKLKSKKFNELLADKDVKFEKELKEQYKAKGIDIDELSHKIVALEAKKQLIQEKLGKALVDKAPDSDLNVYKIEIESIIAEEYQIMLEKLSYLQFSLESQLQNYMYQVFTSLIAEKKVNDTWIQVWKTVEDLENTQDEELINTVAKYSTFILKNEV